MSIRKPSGEWTPERCEDLWCDEIARIAASDFALSLGVNFGDVAVRAGCTELALVWARAFREGSLVTGLGEEVDRASALGVVASALGPGPRATDLLIEAFSTDDRVPVVGLLTEHTLDDPDLAAAAWRAVDRHAGTPIGIAEFAWLVVRAPEDEPKALAAIAAALPEADEPSRIAIHAALWIIHRRRRDVAAAGESRGVVYASLDRLAEMPHFVNAAVVAAACDAGEIEGVSDAIGRSAHRELVDAFIRGGHRDRAFEMASPELRVRIAHRLRSQAPELFEQTRRSEERIEQHYDEGLLTTGEAMRVRFEFAATRDDRARAAAELTALVASAVESHETITLNEVLAGIESRDDLGDEADAKWLSPKGEQRLASALAAWEALDKQGRRRQVHRVRQILDAAASIALDGDIDRAKTLMERAFADDEMVISGFDEIETSAMKAYVATGRLGDALAFAQHRPLKPASLRPLIVALAEAGEDGYALDLLGPALEEATSVHGYQELALATLALVEDLDSTRDAMLDALDGAFEELEKFAGPAAAK